MSEASTVKKKKGGKKEKAIPKGTKRQESEDPPAQQEELTEEEYKAKKLEYIKIAVLADREYNKARTKLRGLKFAAVSEYKKKVEEDQCPEFLAQKTVAEELMEKKRNINLVTKQLKLAQIRDEFEAETQMNETQFDDNYTYAKERFINFFNELIAERKRRKREVDAILAVLLDIPPLPNETTARPVLTETVVFEGRQTRSRTLALAKERQRIAAEEAAAKPKQPPPPQQQQQRKKRSV